MATERYDYMRPNPEALFADNLDSEQKKRNFWQNFLPVIERGAAIRMYIPDFNFLNEKEQWTFFEYHKDSGTVRITSDQGKRAELPLLTFYLLNPDAAPTDLRLPISYGLEVWDTYTPDPSQRLFDEYGSIRDEVWDILMRDERMTEKKLNTLLPVVDIRKTVAELAQEFQGSNSIDRSSLTANQQRDLVRRDMIFSIEREALAA